VPQAIIAVYAPIAKKCADITDIDCQEERGNRSRKFSRTEKSFLLLYIKKTEILMGFRMDIEMGSICLTIDTCRFRASMAAFT